MTYQWASKKLRDVCKIEKAQNTRTDIPYVGMEDIESGTGKFLGSHEPRTVKSSSFFFTSQHILYGRLRPYLNKVLLPSFEGHCSTEIFPIKTYDVLEKRFLYYWLTSAEIVAKIDRTCTGTRMPRANMNEVVEFELPVPPIEEQRRIVGVLDEALAAVSTAVDNTARNRQNAQDLFDSYLQSIFANPSADWEETKLEKVLEVQPQNGWSPPAANHSSSGTPVLTLSSVTGFYFKPNKIKFTSAPTDSKRHYWVKNGDFLITRSNTPELVGHVAIASGISKPTIYPDLIMRMNPKPNRLITKFLYYQMRSSVLRKEITGRAHGANPTMKKISNGAVRSLPILVPPLTIQQACVEVLDALHAETQRLEAIYQQKLAALNELKQSLLHQAFSGKL